MKILEGFYQKVWDQQLLKRNKRGNSKQDLRIRMKRKTNMRF